jgi:hypothetical protein
MEYEKIAAAAVEAMKSGDLKRFLICALITLDSAFAPNLRQIP